MPYKYALKETDKEKNAKALGVGLSISTKLSLEICSLIRKKKLGEAKKMLKEVMEHKKAVPLKRFNKDVGHKSGIGAGRYPLKAAGEILKLLENAEANAQFKGLNTSNLFIRHILAQQASRPFHYGRKRRRKMKRTHIEVVVEEGSK